MSVRHFRDGEYNDDTPPPDREPPHYNYRGGGRFDGAIKQIGLAIIIAGIVGFVSLVFAVNGAISNLRETQGVQGKSIEFLQAQMSDLKQDQRRVEGKVFRGAARELGLNSADEP